MANILNKITCSTPSLYSKYAFFFLFVAISIYDEENYAMIHERILVISNCNYVDRTTVLFFSGIYTPIGSAHNCNYVDRATVLFFSGIYTPMGSAHNC
jgi:hypothetical protein